MLFAVIAALAPVWHVYVSADGNDHNDGRSWKSAYRTIQHALDAARKEGGSRTIEYDGAFQLDHTLVLDKSLSGLRLVGNGAISTAYVVTGWKPDTFNGIHMWSAPAPAGAEPREMFVGPNLVRAPRPRLPSKGFYHLAGLTNGAMEKPWNEGQTEALYKAGDLSDMKNLGDVELVAHHFWVTSRLPIESIDDKQHLVKFKKRSVFRLSDDYSGQAAPYYLDNVSEALKQPCQWYWDRPSGRIYYVPRPGDHLTTFEARIPRLGPVVEIDGASNITLNGRFMGAEWDLPNDSSGDVQAAVAVPGALVLKDAVNCELTCSVFACGTYGIELIGACKNNRILNCFLGHLGAGGIKVGHGTSGTTVRDCMISDDGEVHASAVGIWIGNSGHNVVSHNLILDLGYTGISVGWTWGYGPSDAVDNVIENNLIANIGQGLLSDMGGIYTLGVSPGTIIRNNKIESVKAWGYGGWGIYLDEGSSHILVENNVVTNCKTGSFHQHYGQDNEIRNNIFMFAQQDGQIIRSRPEDHNSFTMENNIIEWRKTPLFGGNLQGPGFVFRSNLLWKTDGSPDLPAFVDKSNLVADPSFDPYPFGLPASSPAFKIGFKPIELDDFGPRQQHSTKGR